MWVTCLRSLPFGFMSQIWYAGAAWPPRTRSRSNAICVGPHTGLRLRPSVVMFRRWDPSGLAANTLTCPLRQKVPAGACPYTRRSGSAGEKLAPQIAPLAITFEVFVWVSTIASPELWSCLPGLALNSSTATYRDSGDHASACAPTRLVVKNLCTAEPGPYTASAEPLPDSVAATCVPYGETTGTSPGPRCVACFPAMSEAHTWSVLPPAFTNASRGNIAGSPAPEAEATTAPSRAISAKAATAIGVPLLRTMWEP